MPDIHPTAVIAPNAHFGAYVKVWSNAVIGFGVEIADYVVIGSNCYIGAWSKIGESSRLQHGVFLPNGSILGKKVFIGPNVTFTDDRYPKCGNINYKADPPIIEDEAAVGAGATILPGVRIGKGAMVGAGAVVTRDVEPYETVVGCPAEPMRLKEAI